MKGDYAMVSERERILLRWLLKEGKITKENLFDADYYENEVNDIMNERNLQVVYCNVSYETANENNKLIASVLGNNWRKKYDYTEKRKRNKCELFIWLTKEEFDALCDTKWRSNL